MRSDVCIVLDRHVAGEGYAVGQGGVVADFDIVGNMDIGHQQIVVPDLSDEAAPWVPR